LIQDFVSLDAALALLGITAVLTGALRMLGTFRGDQTADRMRLVQRFVLGSIEILVGLLFIVVGDVSRPLTISVGLWALVGGTIMLIDALTWRRTVRSGGTPAKDSHGRAE
jgi:uncharacterized membrane protein HdeD (DUF308 family)